MGRRRESMRVRAPISLLLVHALAGCNGFFGPVFTAVRPHKIPNPKDVAKQAASDTEIMLLKDTNAYHELHNAAKREGRSAVIKIYATWCRSCKAMGPKYARVARDPEFAHIGFYEIPFDDNKALCKKLGIKVLPVVEIIAGKEGKVASFACGPSKISKLKSALEEHCPPPSDGAADGGSEGGSEVGSEGIKMVAEEEEGALRRPWLHKLRRRWRRGNVEMMVREPASPPRYLAPGSRWPGSQTAVAVHMTPSVISIGPEATLKEAALLMNKNRVTGLAVCEADSGNLLGEISRTDMLRVISEGSHECETRTPPPEWCEEEEGDAVAELESIESMEVRAAMHPATTVQSTTTMAEAAQIMYPRHLNRLFVIDGEDGSLCGIITSTDVMRVALCDEVSEIDYSDV